MDKKEKLKKTEQRQIRCMELIPKCGKTLEKCGKTGYVGKGGGLS